MVVGEYVLGFGWYVGGVICEVCLFVYVYGGEIDWVVGGV